MFNGNNPRAYATGNEENDSNQPSLHESLHGEDNHHYIAVMKLEISQQLKHKILKRIDKKDVPIDEYGKPRRISKGTWARKLNRLPDGTHSKYKTIYCARGYLQTDGVNSFETYAPAAQ